MAKDFDLATILALADGGGYGGGRTLTPNSAALLLCSAAYFLDYNRWQGAEFELTDDEIDTIDALVAQLELDLQVASGGGTMECVKVKSNVHQTYVHNASIPVAFQETIYDDDGMHDPVTDNYKIIPVSSGKFIFDIALQWSANGTGSRICYFIRYRPSTDTTTYEQIDYAYNNQGLFYVCHNFSVQVDVVLGDEFRVVCQQNSGSTMYLYTRSSSCYFSAVKVG